MNVSEICKDLTIHIKSKGKINGVILSVYTNAFNILTEEEELISVLSSGKSIAPNSILLIDKIDFVKLEIIRGMEIVISDGEITIPDIDITFNTSKAKIWNSRNSIEFCDFSEDNLLKKLNLLEKLIYKQGNLDGIAPIIYNLETINKDYKLYNNINVDSNQYSTFIIERINVFIKIVSKCHKYKIPFIVNRLIGFGPGLTPSVDDFVSGIMLSLEYLTDVYDLDKDKVRGLNSKILECSLNRTTKVSEEMLRHASVGKTTKFNKDFITALLTNCNEKAFIDKFTKVINFGDTSGTDMVCGVYIGFRIILNNKNRRYFINEGKC